MTHVNQSEIEKVKKLIEVLQMRQSLLSETTLVSEDVLCPICYAQQIGKIYNYFQFTYDYL
jgi:Kip1 ubiquitination-promoting complex protein 1